MKKLWLGALACVASIASMLGVSSAALAAPWPTDGHFTIPGTSHGGAVWILDDYGLASALDVNGDMANGLYYPVLAYGQDYVYCGYGNGSDSTVTPEPDGAISIDCLPNSSYQLGITYRMHLRLYPENESGYLARQWVEYTNTTSQPISQYDPVTVYFFFGTNDYESGQPWMTNQGASISQSGDVWTAQGSTSGDQIATSAAWSAPCGSEGWTMGFESSSPFFPHAVPPDSSLEFAPGETKNRISFINMTFPSTNDAAGASAAFDTARSLAETEFSAGLTGRLAAGLPDGLVVNGWNDGACAPELPNTGVDSNSLGLAGLAALGLVLAGCAALVVRRRAHA